jgi:hypothetical protein
MCDGRFLSTRRPLRDFHHGRGRDLEDSRAAEEGYVRVIDESGESSLYPEACFVPIDLPTSVERALGGPGTWASSNPPMQRPARGRRR